MSKTITVDDEIWEELSIRKIGRKKDTISDLIKELLNNAPK